MKDQNSSGRRQYGYIEEKPEPENRQFQKRPKKTLNKPKNNPLAENIIIFLSKLLRFLVILPFKILGWLWQRLRKLLDRKGLNPKNSPKRKALRKKLTKSIITFGVIGIIVSSFYVVWISRNLPDPDRLTDRQIAQSTKIYDKTGEHLLYEIFADQKRTLVDLEDIPQDLINAVIATEDTKFYEHKGIRPLSIMRAFVYGVIRRQRPRGTSTLTQQLVKNAILTNEQTISRKIKEAILSVRLEQKYTKDQILKIYFNEIPYGSTNYGVESAAQSYFGKSVSELDLQEMATLAGLPKAPSRYLRNKKALKDRRDFVLERMVAEGFLDRDTADTAQATEVSLKNKVGNIDAPHFVFYVKDQLNELYGEQTVDTGGLKVITTLDWEKQQAADKAVTEVAEKVFEEANANNAALVSMNPNNGHILAMVGSRDFLDDEIDGQFNVATQGLRQPGSSFKPIVYTAAFEKGYTPETVLFDVETNFAVSGKDYKPLNYDLKEHGSVTMRKALQGSLNIPAVKTLYLVGPKKGVEFSERLGYSTLGEGDFGLSLVLGGGEVRLLEHVSAYSIFANGGTKNEPVSILKVEDGHGDTLYEWKSKKGERVLEEKVTATISNVLSDDNARAYAFGADGILTIPGKTVAAKTGTTNGYIDAWTVGYTPNLVTGVWAGNTNNTPMKRGFGGSKVAAPIWNQYMREALAETPDENFPEIETEEITKPILKGSTGGSGVTLLIDKLTGKIATSSTPESYIVERTFIPPHSILHYVKKDDPRGEEPTDPTVDSQYEVWETAIQDWVKRKREENPDWDIAFGEPPTEFDDLHSLELIPSINVIFPAPSSTLNSRQIDTDIRVSAPRGVSKVTYKIDNRFVGVVREHPFNLNYYAAEVADGNHVMEIIVEDDIGNRMIQEIPFTMSAGVEPANVSWAESNLSLEQNQFPRVFFLNPFKVNEIKLVKFYKQKNNGGKELIGSVNNFTDLFNNQISFKWNEIPDKSNYTLSTELVTDSGVRSGGELKVEVK